MGRRIKNLTEMIALGTSLIANPTYANDLATEIGKGLFLDGLRTGINESIKHEVNPNETTVYAPNIQVSEARNCGLWKDGVYRCIPEDYNCSLDTGTFECWENEIGKRKRIQKYSGKLIGGKWMDWNEDSEFTKEELFTPEEGKFSICASNVCGVIFQYVTPNYKDDEVKYTVYDSKGKNIIEEKGVGGITLKFKDPEKAGTYYLVAEHNGKKISREFEVKVP